VKYLIKPDFATFQRRAPSQFAAWNFYYLKSGFIHPLHAKLAQIILQKAKLGEIEPNLN